MLKGMLSKSSFRPAEKMKSIQVKDAEQVQKFVLGLLQPNVDDRFFEIVICAVLIEHYADQVNYWVWSMD